MYKKVFALEPFSSQQYFRHGVSPGLVVMGGDSEGSEGYGFESQHRILDENFSHTFVVTFV